MFLTFRKFQKSFTFAKIFWISRFLLKMTSKSWFARNPCNSLSKWEEISWNSHISHCLHFHTFCTFCYFLHLGALFALFRNFCNFLQLFALLAPSAPLVANPYRSNWILGEMEEILVILVISLKFSETERNLAIFMKFSKI